MNQPKSLQAGTRIDDYEITETLWTTNSGFTYRARDLDRDREVLVQEYLPAILATRHWSGIHAMALEGLEDDFDQGVTQFLREARILAQINDPYVCRVYEYTETNATAYMVLDYEPGRTLAEHLAARKARLDETEVRQLLVPLLKGLRVAHAADLLHRDIHPANIYVRDVGPPVLIGFGSRTIMLRDDSRHHLEQRVAPGYSPVEQYQSDGDIGPWSDLYALGATMYRCLSGAKPVDATRRITHIAQDKEDPLVPALELGGGDYSAGLLSAVDWMLEPMASDRPESAGAVLGSLNEASARHEPERVVDRTDGKNIPGKNRRSDATRRKQIELPYRDYSQTRAPASHRAAATDAGAATPTTLRVAADDRRPSRTKTPLHTVWGWPLVMIVTGLTLIIGVFVLYEPEPSRSLAVGNTAPQAAVPAPAPDDGYPPPDIPDTVKFDRQRDDERAARYRNLERQIERIEQTLASAAEHRKAGRLVSPPGDNALADYRAVLELDPDHVDARLGLRAIHDELIEAAGAALETGETGKAKRLVDQAGKIRTDSEQVTALRGRIESYVAKQEREARRAREEERRREEAERKAAQQRRERLAALVDRAQAAFEDGRLTQPPGDNALGYYRRALRLDPGHGGAHAGITRIGRRYLDRAAEALARDELDKADGLLSTAAAILPDNESVPLLQKQLETRRAVAAVREREREEAERRAHAAQAEREKERTAVEQGAETGKEGPAMAEGITAYYAGNYELAFRRLNPLAEQGNPRAKFRVAMMYYHGRGIGQDANLARALIEEALPQIREKAGQGVAWAQADLGSLYADGIVLTENDSEALRLYRLAAEQGYAGAQTNLGVMYANGEGVAASRDDAVLWLRRAAAQGDHIAQNNLRALGAE